MDEFYQKPPVLQDIFGKNKSLQLYLKSILRSSKGELKTFLKDIEAFSKRVETEIEDLNSFAIKNPPEHIPYSPWGQRIDHIELSKSWHRFQEISAEEALISVAYKKSFGQYSRLYQFVKLFLFHPSSSFFTCPLAMTDGAVKCLSALSKDPLALEVIKRLTSTDPKQFTTCGQWMTEREGGSDVSRSSTEARLENGQYRIYGAKWFTSDVASTYATTLARTDGKEGSKGLSLFLMKIKDSKGRYINMTVRRLKDKLGTKVLPTAEVDLNGTPAVLIGEKYQGVKNISNILNITRLYNSICALGQSQRAYDLALDYSLKRESFGSLIKEHPLHAETLSDIQTTQSAALAFVLHTSLLLGRTETKPEKTDDLLLRLLIPLGKIVTGKLSLQLSSESLECIGGAAYVEDTGLPIHLRDSQVFSLWEGTSNILSLDVLRVLAKHPEILSVYEEDIKKRLSACKSDLVGHVEDSLKSIKEFLVKTTDRKLLEASAREITFSLFYTYTASLVLEHAQWAKDNKETWFLTLAQKFCSQKLFFCKDRSLESLKKVQESL